MNSCTQCNRTAALDGLFKQLFQPPQEKVALIGSGCSVATEATAEISHYYNITHVSSKVHTLNFASSDSYYTKHVLYFYVVDFLHIIIA